MKKLLLALILVSCGDNIHPATPDALVEVTPDHQPKPDPEGDAAVADAGVDAPDTSVCDDKHVELNGHEHKCQHDQP